VNGRGRYYASSEGVENIQIKTGNKEVETSDKRIAYVHYSLWKNTFLRNLPTSSVDKKIYLFLINCIFRYSYNKIFFLWNFCQNDQKSTFFFKVLVVKELSKPIITSVISKPGNVMSNVNVNETSRIMEYTSFNYLEFLNTLPGPKNRAVISIKRCINFWSRSCIANARVQHSIKSPPAHPKDSQWI
jgi:hypothetical protein